ncbi:MAG TPA: malto-oligosyltrehalose synthase [Clostridia bacterium]|nr:malto-oligosyltrehalose synthase [Clostridia bacterium]
MHTESTLLSTEAAGISECLDRLSSSRSLRRPASTYRFQFNRQFRFVDATGLVPYLDQLGVGTCYASPILMARAGSMHGYDIVDHARINPEIGTEEEFQALVEALHSRGMTLIVDVVPNHMGVGFGTNPWWQDVLRNGRASKFANYFDIDWDPLKPELRNKVLLPILGNQYGQELEDGRLKLVYRDGDFRVEYYDKVLPIDPQSISMIFRSWGNIEPADDEATELLGLLAAFDSLPPHHTDDPERATKRQHGLPFLKQRFAELVERSPKVREHLHRALENIKGQPGDPRSFDALHALLEAQPYRLAHWRVSAEEINFRRFFDINDLVGLRMEDPQVFAATQTLIRRLLANGSVSGLRIDHPDGLFNPPQYFTRLQMLYAASQCYGETPVPPLAENGIELEMQMAFGRRDWRGKLPPLYVVVEKILEPGEELPRDWSVDGTVGYEFANLVTNLFIDSRAKKTFTNLYERFIGQSFDIDGLIYQSKKLIMHSALSSEVNVLGHMLDEISSLDRRARDFTRKSLRDAIREAIACFPVYRTYIDERGNISERDRRYIDQAIARAMRRNGSMPKAVFEFLHDILLLRGNDGGKPVHGYRKQLYFTLKFQQLTGPVMAKGLEDTVCYVYNRFVAVNEVGGSPHEFGIGMEGFHHAMARRAADWPYAMLATSTHDTKRSEDVRMRLAVLSEMPRLWAANVMRWRRINKQRKRTISDGRLVPDPNEEYLLYQTLVGTWPLPGAVAPSQGVPGENTPAQGASFALTGEQRAEYTSRIQQYMTKAVHEAKANLSWINDNPEYVEALRKFIAKILEPGSESKPNSFIRTMQEFVPRVAFFGILNSMSQTLLKLTLPGVPDVYQGQELLDFSLVDPDNRRPVDYSLRQRCLDQFANLDGASYLPSLAGMLHDWADGRLKLWVTHRALRARREHLELFQDGSYVPLRANHDRERHAVAFARTHATGKAVTVVPRFSFTLMNGELAAPLGEAWGEAGVELPPEFGSSEFVNTLTGERISASGGRLLCREVFRSFPLALLMQV